MISEACTSVNKFLIVMPKFYEQVVGGAEYQSYLLARGAKTRFKEVHYAFVSKDSKYPNHLGLDLLFIKPYGVSKKLGANWFIYSRQVLSLLRRIIPDVIYVRGGWSFCAVSAYYTRRHSAKSIWHVASDSDLDALPFCTSLKRPFDIIEKTAIRYAIHNSSLVIAQTNRQASILLEKFGRKAIVIPNFHPVPQFRKKSEGKLKVLWIGNIKPLKRPDLFVRLALELSDMKNLQFVMIGRSGSGAYSKSIMAMIENLSNLEFTGELPLEEVNIRLEEADLFINTSDYEGMPNTFIQAWMRQVPVLSLTVDPDGILQREGLGFCAGSYERLVALTRQLVLDEGRRKRIGEKARLFAIEQFSEDSVLPRLLDTIERIKGE